MYETKAANLPTGTPCDPSYARGNSKTHKHTHTHTHTYIYIYI